MGHDPAVHLLTGEQLARDPLPAVESWPRESWRSAADPRRRRSALWASTRSGGSAGLYATCTVVRCCAQSTIAAPCLHSLFPLRAAACGGVGCDATAGGRNARVVPPPASPAAGPCRERTPGQHSQGCGVAMHSQTLEVPRMCCT